MRIIVFLLSIVISIKTLSCGIYELKNKNKPGGITVILISIICLVLPSLILHFRGI